ncbi:MAG: discoidin domain-containing protein, partial [Clostridia bacterium]|nr:discoidin domain-containing protein [Clostridia bacterium]
AYTFICDFQADTTYTVTVSSDVKSSVGINAETYTHTFTTAEELIVAENVSPTNDASYFYEKSGAFGTVSNAYGGNAGAYWANNASVSKVWFGVDLGKAYDIAYISYVPGFPSAGASWGNNINIQVSNDSEFKTYETLALTLTLSAYDGSVRYMVANDTDEKYQYVRLYKAGSYMALSDFLVYAYPGAPTVTSVTPSGDNVSKAAIGKIEFDTAMDIATLTSANITVTDENGAVIEQKETSAYDSAYTFICDFKAGTTYTVTVSSNVKSAVGINAETYTHTFTTAEELIVAENVSPANDESYFYEKSGAFGNVSNAYGTTSPPHWANNANVTKVWFGVDLGKAYDIAYIAYVPGFPSASAVWANNINIQVSNDSEFKTYETLALTPTLSAYDGSVRYMVANDTDTKYQYVRLFKTSKNIALADFLVYAYAEAPTIEAITPSGDNVTKAATCKVKFDMAMDRATLTSENIVIKDEDGNILEQKNVSVYDTEYVFMCDFEANTTYKVTVSTNVMSKAGLFLEAA